MQTQVLVETAKSRLVNSWYHSIGLAFLVLAKLKHELRGYATPKPFTTSDIERCVDYDLTIANRFLKNLARYKEISIAGKRVLELGPGSDLGVGLILLKEGASSYVGFDKNGLAHDAPYALYDRLASSFGVDLGALTDGRVSYVVQPEFNVDVLDANIDLVFSNAAFEHFDDVDSTVGQLSRVTRPGALAVVEVDLQTHSRWIRNADPNNIYRYPNSIYRLLRFPGQPNRLRPNHYYRSFARHGWENIQMYPENRLPDHMKDRAIHPSFADEQMDWLSFVLCATRA